MSATNKAKESTLEKNMMGCSFIIFIIFVFFLWVGSCGDEEEPQETQEPPKVLTPEEQRKEDVSHCFNPWDGSHIELTRLIKESMNDPDSYSHVETIYYDHDSVLLVKTTFRGRNGFGGIVKQTILAETGSINCYVIEMVSQ